MPPFACSDSLERRHPCRLQSGLEAHAPVMPPLACSDSLERRHPCRLLNGLLPSRIIHACLSLVLVSLPFLLASLASLDPLSSCFSSSVSLARCAALLLLVKTHITIPLHLGYPDASLAYAQPNLPPLPPLMHS